MAPRPYWKGYLKLSLVSCAVALYPSTSKSERISFHWLNRNTGNRLRQQMIDGGTGEPVDREDRVRGYEVSKHDYLFIEDDDLDAVEIESSHTIDIESFVPRAEIDPVFLDSAYYLAPDDRVAEEAFSVIRDAMAARGVAGLGRAVISRRERLFVLEPRGSGILASSLHYNYEVRRDEAYFQDIPELKISKEMLNLAEHIIGTKMAHFDINRFEDRYENALIEMIRAKQAGRPAAPAHAPQPGNVINLMEALRESVAADRGREAQGSGAATTRKASQATTSRKRQADENSAAAAPPSPPSRRTPARAGSSASTSKRRVGAHR